MNYLDKLGTESGNEFEDEFRSQRRMGPKPQKKVSKELRYAEGTTRDLVLGDTLVRVWSEEMPEHEVMVALRRLSKYPDIFPFVSIMPDFHISETIVNGAVIPTRNTLFVSAIGGDIGCGMTSLRLPITQADIPDLREVYEKIYAAVPTGRRINQGIEERVAGMPLFASGLEVLNHSNTNDALYQFGTLGSGNHFIEVQKDDDGKINLMVHTGSRSLGQNIRKAFMQRAKMVNGQQGVATIPADSADGKSYLAHINLALDYARENRAEILRRVWESLKTNVPKLSGFDFKDAMTSAINVPHNYISVENHFGQPVYVHRKGAMHIPAGSIGVIPGSMGTPSYVVEGRGNAYSLDSASHGAGRKMSRAQALNTVKQEDYVSAMGGIVCRTDANILDEAPQAYKDIDKVMRQQRDLVKIVEKLTPLASIKG